MDAASRQSGAGALMPSDTNWAILGDAPSTGGADADGGEQSGGWTPLGHEEKPAAAGGEETERPNGKGAGIKEKVATPITVTVDLDADISGSLKAIVEGQAALAAGIADVNAALKANATAMETWLKRLDRVMSAPRSVTLKRGEDGMAKSAIAETLVSKAKG
jgi:hypothetical protein